MSIYNKQSVLKEDTDIDSCQRVIYILHRSNKNEEEAEQSLIDLRYAILAGSHVPKVVLMPCTALVLTDWVKRKVEDLYGNYFYD